jgi:glycosyltransferase involved in cell wall biosynthesis
MRAVPLPDVSDDRPSLLAVTSELPWPLDTGGHLRSFHLLHALAQDCRVRLVTAIGVEQMEHAETLEGFGIVVRAALVRPRRRFGEARRAAGAALAAEPYVMYRRHGRPALRAAVRAELARERPDVLYLDHLDSFQFAGEANGTPTVLDLHNVYSLLLRREAAEPTRIWPARRYLAREAGLLERIEATAIRTVSEVFSVSAQEQAHFAAIRGARVHLVPNGVDCRKYAGLPIGRAASPPTILFIGTLSWPPNAAAARFLATEILPVVRARVPEATLTLVGRNPGADVQALKDIGGVDVVGNARDILPHLRDARLLAVPLEAGGGTRLKILEAFAAGLPVVSTPIGCEGLAGVDGRELLIADRERFADAVSSILEDPAGGERLAARARVLATQTYDWTVVGRTARHVVHEMVGRSAEAAAHR